MSAERKEPFRVLVLCTGNSARSQMAEALFNALGGGRVVAESAGSQPAPRVNPLAIETLARHGIVWKGHEPRSVDGLEREPWDAVITVCDKAREACPVFPAHPAIAHWGMSDPAEVVGSDEARREAFWQASLLLRKRIELMLALPLEKLERLAVEARLRAIGAAPPA
ncbi:MAG TPA: arsenate reductase ArsC [Gemmatimonadales bacterium]|nr:arsenate reductase ArsC [Gemmatimonadales bacterium]